MKPAAQLGLDRVTPGQLSGVAEPLLVVLELSDGAADEIVGARTADPEGGGELAV